MGPLFSLVVWLLVAGFVIWIVGRMNLGLTVRGYMSAIIAAAVIAVVAGVILWLASLLNISNPSGFLGTIIVLLIAAVVLRISDRFLPGMQVAGWKGAIIAAIAIAVIGWIIIWLLHSPLGITI